jgi:hypothetical protein
VGGGGSPTCALIQLQLTSSVKYPASILGQFGSTKDHIEPCYVKCQYTSYKSVIDQLHELALLQFFSVQWSLVLNLLNLPLVGT